MAKTFVRDFVAALLAVSFGAGFGWACHGSTERQPSGLLAVDTTVQSDVQLFQTIAGANASAPSVVVGIELMKTLGTGASLAQRVSDAQTLFNSVEETAEATIKGYNSACDLAFTFGGWVSSVTVGGTETVYIYLPFYGIRFSTLGGDIGLEAQLLSDLRGLSWTYGRPSSVTIGESNSGATKNSGQQESWGESSSGTSAPLEQPSRQHPAATGDFHLQNVRGERFDLMQPGEHVLIQIPRRESLQNTLLRVQAVAQTMGGLCTDTYFMGINVTGKWPSALRPGGFIFRADDPDSGAAPKWMDLHGALQVKVVHGQTQKGIRYLNFYVKHLDRAGLPVGGLLGEDDHEEASTPPRACERRMALLGFTATS